MKSNHLPGRLAPESPGGFSGNEPAFYEAKIMGSDVALMILREQLEDPLAYLPPSNVLEYEKDGLVYVTDVPSSCLYLVIYGRVKVSRLADDGHRAITDVYHAGEFFAESAPLPNYSLELAKALERSKVMMWTTSVLEEAIVSRPRLSFALVQLLVQHTVTLKERIEDFNADKTARRLARSLIVLSQRLGTPEEDGSVRMAPPFTHELLAQYVGASRKVITCLMNQFRRLGCLRYSRKGVVLHCEALHEWLRQNA